MTSSPGLRAPAPRAASDPLRPAGPTATPAAVERLRVAVACLALVALSFSQSPGLLVADTKLDLAVAPLRFLERALHLWDPQGAFGQLQNQAYGYLFPMGPFFAAGELLALPGWVVQRLWLALVLCTALLGARRLARELGIGTPGLQLLAGVAYALSPRVLTVGGPISIEAWPLALLPWVLVPLVRGARQGSERRAAALSGVAVLCIGGVNAAATLAVLPLAGLFLLTRLGSARGRRLAGWWALAVPLATLWWLLPLLLLGHYSLPFLDYIETAATTTAGTSLVEVLRGTSHWLAYLAFGEGPWWRAGWALVTSSPLILATAVVAALGLAGLVRRDMPERVWLLGGVLLGTLLVTAGHVGSLPWWLTPPLAETLRELLDGPLAPFRNVHKFDAVLRLPLVLGLAHLVSTVRVRPRTQLPPSLRAPATRPVAAVAVLALLVSATPLLKGELAPRGAFEALPSSWTAVADWLAGRTEHGRALLVPGAPFGEYVWGRPLDEPLQPLADSPWAVRNAVPLGSEGNTRLLDAIEEQLETGQGSPGLAPLLSRAGVTHVVVRYDLDWLAVGAPPPVVAEQALVASPGITAVEVFREPDRRVPPLRVFEVAGATVEGDASSSPVATYAADRLVRLSGGPESLLQVADLAPRLLRERPVVLAGEPGAEQASAVVVTDGMRRREVDFGRTREGSSETLAAADALRLDRPASDLVVVPGSEHRTTAAYDGARAVRASSSASDAGSLGGPQRQHLPFAAFDQDPTTSWRPAGPGSAGEWVEIELDEAREVDHVVLTPVLVAAPRPARKRVPTLQATVTVTTDAGSTSERVVQTPVPQGATDRPALPRRIELPPGRTDSVRVTVAQAGPQTALVGVSELQVPGVDVQRVLAVPADAARAPEAPVTVALSRTQDGRESCVTTSGRPLCAEGLGRVGEEPGALERAFPTVTPAEVELTAVGRPLPGPALDARLAQARGGPLRVSASGTLYTEPAAAPAATLDDDRDTAWVAAPEGAELTLAWDEPEQISGLTVVLDQLPGSDGVAEVTVVPSLEGIVQPLLEPERPLKNNRRTSLPPVVADGITLRFPPTDEPLRVAEVRVLGLGPLHRDAVPAPDRPVTVPCGEGPELELDGHLVQTSLTATYDELARLAPVDLVPCGADGTLALDAGQHRLTGRSTDDVRVDGVLLRDLRMPESPGPVPAKRAVRDVEEWGETSRRVAVGGGAATYLAVKENANAGWSATLDGRLLQAQRLDGWQQGWLLPAGEAGTVELVYTPDRGFRLGLLAGLVAALALLALAAVRRRRPATRPATTAPRGGRTAAALAAAAVVVLGGLAGVLALGAGLLVRRLGRAPAVAGGALLLAGLVVAVRPWPGASAGADSALAQLLALLALGLAATALPAPRAAREPAVDQD